MAQNTSVGKRKFVPSANTIAKHGLQISDVNGKEDQSKESEVSVAPTKERRMFNRNILYEYIRSPSMHSESIVFDCAECTIIFDAYPKANIHLLLLPKESFLNVREVRMLSHENFEQIMTLHRYGSKVVDAIKSAHSVTELNLQHLDKIKSGYCGQVIQFGYHTQPSLYPLHLHIISQDFDSPCLKTKVHWNSFTTGFFVTSEQVERYLSSPSCVNLRDHLLSDEACEEAELSELQCNQCSQTFTTMPKLKEHLHNHFKELSK